MYKKMYNILFNAITESLNFLSEGDTAAAAWRLEEAQRETENILMEWDEDEPDRRAKGQGPPPQQGESVRLVDFIL